MKMCNSIEKYITEKGMCTGCGICVSLFEKGKITIEMNKSGFYRPVFLQELSQDEWNRLEYVCPALNMKYESYSDEKMPLFGRAVECRVGWSTAEDIRFKASSGGGVTSFLLYLLEQKKIDGVIQVGRKDNQLVAEGMLYTNADQIRSNVGSLYMPVAFLENFRELLNKVDRVAIVGKGCDIRAVRRFVELHPEYKAKIIVCIGILCGGTPSIQGTYNILEDFEFQPEEISSFRYRGYGWPGFCTAISHNKTEKKMSYNDAWAKKLGPTSPLVCKICFDGVADAADIVFGDAWKCENGNYPSFEETDGRNLIICKSEVGKMLMDEAVVSEYLELSNEHIDNDQFKIIQPSQSNRRYLAKYKMIGLKMIGFTYPRTSFKYLERVSETSGVNLTMPQKIRSILGSIKRAKLAKEGKI